MRVTSTTSADQYYDGALEWIKMDENDQKNKNKNKKKLTFIMLKIEIKKKKKSCRFSFSNVRHFFSPSSEI